MIETELKCALSYQDFNKLMRHFNPLPHTAQSQTNYYYDTTSSDLKSLHSALRLRTTVDYTEWTIKQAITLEKSLELTLPIAQSITAPSTIDATHFINTDIFNFLQQHHLDKEYFKLITQFTTKRWHVATPCGEIALDYTTFSHHHDYEIELETTDLIIGRQWFNDLLNHLNIPFTPAEKKIKRALDSFSKNEHSNY